MIKKILSLIKRIAPPVEDRETGTRFCRDCKYASGDGAYVDFYCNRGVVEIESEEDLVTGTRHKRSSGGILDCTVERYITGEVKGYPNDRCGKEGKYFMRRR